MIKYDIYLTGRLDIMILFYYYSMVNNSKINYFNSRKGDKILNGKQILIFKIKYAYIILGITYNSNRLSNMRYFIY